MTQKNWRFTSSSTNATEDLLTGDVQLNIEFPTTDLIEKSNQFVLTAELPGYDKNNITIDITNGQILTLTGSLQGQPAVNIDEDIDIQTPNPNVSAQKQQKVNDKDNAKGVRVSASAFVFTDPFNRPNYLVKERRQISGTFKRSFELPCAIEVDYTKATFNNGLLNIIVPKLIKRNRKRIRID